MRALIMILFATAFACCAMSVSSCYDPKSPNLPPCDQLKDEDREAAGCFDHKAKDAGRD